MSAATERTNDEDDDMASDVDQAVDALVGALNSLQRSTRWLRSEQCIALGVSTSEFDALMRIGTDGRVTPTELANFLRITTSATTAVIDRLASAGLVERHRSTRDRRSVLLSLTASGAAQLAWIRSEYRQTVEEAARRDPDLLQPATTGLLAAITEVIDELAETVPTRTQILSGT